MGPIPGSSIIYYSKEFDVSYDNLKTVIRSMDATYLEYIQEERDKKMNVSDRGPNKTKTRTRKKVG